MDRHEDVSHRRVRNATCVVPARATAARCHAGKIGVSAGTGLAARVQTIRCICTAASAAASAASASSANTPVEWIRWRLQGNPKTGRTDLAPRLLQAGTICTSAADVVRFAGRKQSPAWRFAGGVARSAHVCTVGCTVSIALWTPRREAEMRRNAGGLSCDI
jgi:hypothetical protein